MRVLALDLSLNSTGYCDDSGVGLIQPGCVGAERLDFVREALLDGLYPRQGDQTIVAIEGYAYGRANQAHQLGELGGVIRLALYNHELDWVEIPPKLIKLYGCGTGNASKDDVLLAAVRRFGYKGSSKDEADALILHRLVKAGLGEPMVTVPVAHGKAITATSRIIDEMRAKAGAAA